jgi:hypothetical protein
MVKPQSEYRNEFRVGFIANKNSLGTPQEILATSIDDDSLLIINRHNLGAYIDNKIFNNGRYPISVHFVDLIKSAINNGAGPLRSNTVIDAYYKLARKHVADQLKTRYIVENSQELYPAPSSKLNQRDCIVVTGPSGVGKSWWAAKYCVGYHHVYPTRNIYLISLKDKDEAFDTLPYVNRVPRTRWTEFMGEDAQTVPKTDEVADEAQEVAPGFRYANCLFVFDDVENCFEADTGILIEKFKKYLMEVGRSNAVDIVICNHIAMNYQKTRAELNECTGIVMFPKAHTNYHMANYLRRYLGLKEESLNKILNMQSHYWVCIHKQFPLTVSSDKEIYIMSK